MAPSSTRSRPLAADAAGPAAAGGAAGAIARLAEVERRWRDALSFVAGGDATAALGDVEQAGALLAEVGPLEAARAQATPAELAELAGCIDRLGMLHVELLEQSRRAQDQLGRELAGARTGRSALHAYHPDGEASHRCDALG